jgi:hypothetical protein
MRVMITPIFNSTHGSDNYNNIHTDFISSQKWEQVNVRC